MCGVIGVVLRHPTQSQYEMLRCIFHESKIRGKHATGISYLKQNQIHTERHALPADQCVFDFPSYLNEDGNLYLIGHCRYSTSDLVYNQPIANESLAIVHNGVVSQELPENWGQLYGYFCDTKNDSELLLRTVEKNESPLIQWSGASLAVCELHPNKTIRAYRNGKRPLYLTIQENGYLLTSTSDIPRRAGIQTPTEPFPMNEYVTFDANLFIRHEKVCINTVDLQGMQYV